MIEEPAPRIPSDRVNVSPGPPAVDAKDVRPEAPPRLDDPPPATDTYEQPAATPAPPTNAAPPTNITPPATNDNVALIATGLFGSQRNVNKKEPLALFVNQSPASKQLLGETAGAVEFLQKAGVLKSVELTNEAPANALPFLIGNDKAYVVLNEAIDTEAENAKINEEIARLEGQLKGVTKKLSNERFVSNAPDAVVAMEKKKQADWTAKVESLKAMLG